MTYAFSYNQAGLPLSATNNGAYTFASGAAYSAAGQLTALNEAVYNGYSISLARTFNSRLQPLNVTVTPSGHNSVLNETYSFTDANGHNNGSVASIANNLDNSRTASFTYDSLNRIQTAGTSVWTETFTGGIDQWGNLKAVTSTGGAPSLSSVDVDPSTNRLTGVCSGTCYDAAGNMVNDGMFNYSYDAEGRQISAGAWTYIYDGLGRRVEKRSGSSGTIFWLGGSNDVLSETDLAGNNGYEYYFFDGSLISRRRTSDGTIWHYFRDALGSSRVMLYWGGATACYDADFYPFGGEKLYTNNCAQNYKFAGMERDSETGNDHTRFRQYMYNYGRWMTPDPAGLGAVDLTNPQTLNRYQYVGNTPTNHIDPLGLFTDWCATNPWLSFCPGPGNQDGGGSGDDSGGGSGDGCMTNRKGNDSNLFASLCPEEEERSLVAFADPAIGCGEGGGGGGGGAGNPRDFKAAFETCLGKYFKNVTISSVTESTKGHNGNFSGVLPNGKPITVTNDVNSFNLSQLNDISHHNDGKGDANGLTLVGLQASQYLLGGRIANPFSVRTFDIYTNYTASDLSPSDYLSNQMHELAHSLDVATGNAPLNNEKIPMGFSDCVNQQLLKQQTQK